MKEPAKDMRKAGFAFAMKCENTEMVERMVRKDPMAKSASVIFTTPISYFRFLRPLQGYPRERGMFLGRDS